MIEYEVETWEEFNKQAKRLVNSGFTDVMPYDKPEFFNYPAQPKLGYMFADPFDEKDNAWVFITADNFRRTRPNIIGLAFQTELGKVNVAKSWGNYKEREMDSNVKELSISEIIDIEDKAKNDYLRSEIKKGLESYNISQVDDCIEDFLDDIMKIIEKEKSKEY